MNRGDQLSNRRGRGATRGAGILLALAAATCGEYGREPATSLAAEPVARLTSLPGNETSPRYSPDGRWIAFVNDGRGQPDVLLLELATGQVTQVAAGAAAEGDPAWSPDGTSLAYTSDEGGSEAVWKWRMADGTARRLTPQTARSIRPLWSPDGTWITYSSADDGSLQVWLTGPDGGDPRALTSGPTEHRAYGWSPDGAAVLGIEIGGATHDVWAWAVDGGEPRRLTSRVGEEWWPAWSPTGERVAFYTTWDDAMTDVWVADVASGELTQITDLPVEDFRPTWSPDGDWLAYSSDREAKSGLWLSRPDGSEAVSVTQLGRAGGLPQWSPDGGSLVFSLLVSKARLFAVPAAGGEPEALTDGTASVVEPAASFDGEWVAFESENVGSEADLYLLRLSDGERIRLTEEVAYNARPSWSPDGTALAFERSPGGGPRTTQVAVYRLADGFIEELTDHGHVRSPVWCGEGIAYTREAARAGEVDRLWWVPARGGEPRAVTSGPYDERTTDCSRDGTRVLFHTDIDGDPIVHVATLDGGALVSVEDLGPGEGARFSPDEASVVYLSRHEGQPDVYARSLADGAVRRLTETPYPESWPDWLPGSDRVIFAADPQGRDLWTADVRAILAARAAERAEG